MRVVRGFNALKRPPTRAVVTIGMFDGVHVAHQRLIQTIERLAKRLRGTSVVITFDPDPHQVLDPRHAPAPLMSLEERLGLIRTLGVDLVWILSFTTQFSRTSPERFVRTILLQRLHASCIVVGEPFAFGKDRRGNLRLLQTLGRQHRMRVVALPPVLRDGQPVSSSRIRQLIQAGKIHEARQLLGRPFELCGTVVRGQARARTFGFPTANVRLTNALLPPRGVYTVLLSAEGGCASGAESACLPSGSRGRQARRRWPGIMNLGLRPTFLPRTNFPRRYGYENRHVSSTTRLSTDLRLGRKLVRGGPGPLVCEVHLLGFNGNLYGRKVAIGLLKRLRAERQFASPQALIRQITRDVAHARRALAR